jgi:hypothetical protein
MDGRHDVGSENGCRIFLFRLVSEKSQEQIKIHPLDFLKHLWKTVSLLAGDRNSDCGIVFEMLGG